MRIIAYTAPYSIGSLGQILYQFVEDARLRRVLHKYYLFEMAPLLHTKIIYKRKMFIQGT